MASSRVEQPLQSRRTQQPFHLLLWLDLHEVEACPHGLTRLEVHAPLGRDGDALTRARVAAGPRLAVPYCKGAEITQLDAIPDHESIGHPIEDGADHPLDIAGIQVRVLGRDAGDKLGPDHAALMPRGSSNRNRTVTR